MGSIANEKGLAPHRPALRIAARSDTAFTDHRQAALALLTECAVLSHKEAGFLGHMCVAANPSEKQLAWLAKLLDRKGLPPLARGGAHG